MPNDGNSGGGGFSFRFFIIDLFAIPKKTVTAKRVNERVSTLNDLLIPLIMHFGHNNLYLCTGCFEQ